MCVFPDVLVEAIRKKKPGSGPGVKPKTSPDEKGMGSSTVTDACSHWCVVCN